MGTQLTTHFNLDELKCRCGHCHLSPDLIHNLLLVAQALEKIRKAFDKPIHVNCGYRCPSHNAAIGGAKESQHLRALAADITIEGETPQDVACVACTISEIGGIGKYPSQNFTHIDLRAKAKGKIERWNG